MQKFNIDMKKLVSILVPCYNEEASLPKFYEEVSKLMNTMTNYEWELFFRLTLSCVLGGIIGYNLGPVEDLAVLNVSVTGNNCTILVN